MGILNNFTAPGFRNHKDGNESRCSKPRSIGPIAAESPSGVKVLCQRHTSYYAGQARDPRSGTDSAPTESPGTCSPQERERKREPLNFAAVHSTRL